MEAMEACAAAQLLCVEIVMENPPSVDSILRAHRECHMAEGTPRCVCVQSLMSSAVPSYFLSLSDAWKLQQTAGIYS